MARAKVWKTTGTAKVPANMFIRVEFNERWLIQADLTSIGRKVLKQRDSTLTNSGSVTVSASVFDALQTTGWLTDSLGYNFADQVPASAFPDPGPYWVEYLFTPVAGSPFTVSCDHNTLEQISL